MANRQQHGFRWQYIPETSAWPSEVIWATDINTGPGCSRTTDPDMGPGRSINYRHQHGLRWLHRPLTSTLSLEAAWPTDINLASGSDTNHRHLLALPW